MIELHDMTIRYKTEIGDPFATCSCGWVGPVRELLGEAVDDFDNHTETAFIKATEQEPTGGLRL